MKAFQLTLSPATFRALLCHEGRLQIVALMLCASAFLPHCGYCWVFSLLVKQNSTHVCAILGHFPSSPQYHHGSPKVLELPCLPAGFVSGDRLLVDLSSTGPLLVGTGFTVDARTLSQHLQVSTPSCSQRVPVHSCWKKSTF